MLGSIAATVALVAMTLTSGTGGSSLAVLFIVPILVVFYVMGCLVAAAAFVLGLPLLLVRKAKAWWAARAWISWLIALVGLGAFIVARLNAVTEVWYDDEGFRQLAYNSPPVPLFGGILLFVFGVLWAPRRPQVEDPPWPTDVPWVADGAASQ